MRRNKISLDKVQQVFNNAIKRRDGRCMVKDYEFCCGQLECSHFYTVGSSSALRFYPNNAYAQCHKHHWNHHNKDKRTYVEYMQNNHLSDLEYMRIARQRYIKYSDELKAEIIRLCESDKLEELAELIEKEIGI